MAAHFQDDTITIHKIQCGSFGNNAYLLICPETNRSIIIDTPPDPGELIVAAKETDVQSILITHNHWDHIEGLDEVTLCHRRAGRHRTRRRRRASECPTDVDSRWGTRFPSER